MWLYTVYVAPVAWPFVIASMEYVKLTFTEISTIQNYNYNITIATVRLQLLPCTHASDLQLLLGHTELRWAAPLDRLRQNESNWRDVRNIESA